MHLFEHIDPADLRSAVSLLSDPGTELIAGGTDLLGELKRRIRRPKRLLNLKAIPELRRIQFDRNLRLGCLATLAEIEQHPKVKEMFPILTQAISRTATPQLRNMGTLGGNLCQHPRCWYYRSPLFPCWLKGGERCFAVQGENTYHALLGGEVCHAVHPSDLAPPLIALGAGVKVVGPRGEEELSLEKLYTQPRAGHRQMTVLGPGDLIAEVGLPADAGKTYGVYLKAMERQAWAFALVSVAACVRVEQGTIREAKLVLGGVSPIPWRAKEAERVLCGGKLSEELAKAAGEASLRSAKPLRDNGYKIELLKGLIGRALTLLAQQEGLDKSPFHGNLI